MCIEMHVNVHACVAIAYSYVFMQLYSYMHACIYIARVNPGTFHNAIYVYNASSAELIRIL